ncbi:MAG: response regulator [Clostridia bacterium]|nr:response regulator [Clostridia bacterium]
MEQNRLNRALANSITEDFLYSLFNFYVSGYYLDLNAGRFYAIGQETTYNDLYGSSDSWSLFDEYIDTQIHAEDRAVLREVSRIPYIRERLSREKNYSVEIRDLATGTERWMRYTTMRAGDADHASISFIDITEEVQRRNRIVELNAELEAQLEEISALNEELQDNQAQLEEAAAEQEAQLEEISALNSELQDNQAQLEEAAAEQEAHLEEITRLNADLEQAQAGLIEENARYAELLEREKQRTAVIGSMANIFNTMVCIDLAEGVLQRIFTQGTDAMQWGEKRNAAEVIERVIANDVSEHDIPKVKALLDLATLAERLRDHKELSVTYRDVRDFWQCATVIPVTRDAEGKVTVVLWTIRNTDAEMRLELARQEELERALVAAEAASRAKSRFLSNMSHDIRTPMNAIIGFTALGEHHVDEPDKMREFLGKIATSGNHLLSLINDILDMSRIESGKVRIEENEVHLPDVLHDLRTIIQSEIAAKNIDFFIDTLDVKDEDVICDRLRLNQVLLNLMSNAMKYTNAGGTVSLRVQQTPCAEEDSAAFEFHVKDTGIGMSPEFLKVVFQPFERMHSTTVSGIQGTGLGLSITKNLVEMMGGTISVSSEEGKGSEFTVRIKFKKGKAMKTPANLAELQGLHVLVADDNAETCFSVSKLLRDMGMRPDWTTGGREAVLRAQYALESNDEYGAYIIDWLMPDMNGVETVRRIRKLIGGEKPIVVLTAYDWQQVEAEAREAGVTSFCAKPLFPSELREALLSAKQKETEQAADVASCDFSGKKVLLVEDNALNREIATEILTESGFIVDIAEDGDIAVEKLRNAKEGDCDVVLMDVQMPRLDGYTATREIRTLANPFAANLPIIAMTANAFDEDKQKSIAAGMNDHISKPIEIPKMISVLAKVLNRN